MCGIAAVIDLGSRSRAHLLPRMLEPLRTRGPDGEGTVSRDGVHLGHRRLRILPCPLAAQPMSSRTSDAAISYNGEVYNFPELARELTAAGVRLATETDTEVVLELCVLRGPEALQSLDGMYAFVLHDRTRREVLVARDRFGQKPLYVRALADGWAFASSIRSLLLPEFGGAEVDSEALHHYLWTLDTFGGRTLFCGIRQLPPGSAFRIGLDDGKWRPCGLPRLRFRGVEGGEPRELAGEFRRRLNAAVRTRAAGVERLACHLSGGLDSSAILACVRGQPATDVAAWTCGYAQSPDDLPDERRFHEVRYAVRVARHLGVQMRRVQIGPHDYVRALGDLVETLEEPKGNPCVPHYLLARGISREHRVFLSGEGADELFAGYPWKLVHAHGGNLEEAADGFWPALLPAPETVLAGLLRGSFRSPATPNALFQNELRADPAAAPLDAVMEYEMRHFLHYLLVQADKLAGRFGLEGRYPFLDDGVVELALELPAALRADPRGRGKPLPRMALRGMLPPCVLARAKTGFVPPEGSWYRGELLGLVCSVLLKPDSFVASVVNAPALHRVVEDHRAGHRNYRKLIWGLLSLELWHQRFFQGRSSGTGDEPLPAPAVAPVA